LYRYSGGALNTAVGSLSAAFIVAGLSFRRGVGKINALATTVGLCRLNQVDQ
jgi:hypothetical protein